MTFDWEESVTAALAQPRVADRQAVAYRSTYATASRPALLLCDNGTDWIVKGPETGKTTTSEQVVCSLGTMLDAPVAPWGLVHVPQSLLDITPDLAHMPAGLAHGTHLIPNCIDARDLPYLNAENRPRYAALSVLYSWVEANDHQVLFQIGSPVLVYSHDHGHFFPSGPDWTEATLAAGPVPHTHPFFDHIGLVHAELLPTLQRLGGITEMDLVHAVTRPPSEWACTIAERVALAKYLWDRKPQVIALFGGV